MIKNIGESSEKADRKKDLFKRDKERLLKDVDRIKGLAERDKERFTNENMENKENV